MDPVSFSNLQIDASYPSVPHINEGEGSNNHLPLFSPLTFPYRDLTGRVIRLWRFKESLIASIKEPDNTITLLPGKDVHNSLQPQENDGALLRRLAEAGMKDWQLSYQSEKRKIYVWPFLRAAGRDDERSLIQQKIDRHKQHTTHSDVNAARRELKGEVVARRADGKPFNHVHEVLDSQDGLIKIVCNVKRKLSRHNLPPEERVRLQNELAQASRMLDRTEQFVPHEVRKQRGFREQLQRHNLTDSYNSSHPKDQMAGKPFTSGQIGGVAVGAGVIQDLFGDIAALFDQQHFVAVPCMDGRPPFSEQELQQLMRELAIGIYQHDTVPFFSLDFNADGHLVPLIHPVYENTMVGKVISLLDYFMKGYLNGGVFEERFLLEWQKKKSDQIGDLLPHLIDFQKYVKEKLGGKDPYFSLRQLLIATMHAESSNDAPSGEKELKLTPLPEECLHLTSSFRIIAKQRTVQRHENFFLLDPDFDVQYTLEPDPAFQEKVRQDKANGQSSSALSAVHKAYSVMALRIKEQMPKLPLCRELFHMLGVISFLSHYFTTLKANGKAPILAPVSRTPVPAVPLFTPLPLRTSEAGSYKLNFHDVYCLLCEQDRKQLINWLVHETSENPNQELIKAFSKAHLDHIGGQLSEPIRRTLHSKDYEAEALGHASEVLVVYCKLLREPLQQHKYDFLNSWSDILARMCRELSSLIPDTKIMEPVLLFTKEMQEKERMAVRRVVGGCGLRFSQLSVSQSLPGQTLFQANSAKLQLLGEGKLLPLTSKEDGSVQAHAFSIPFEDVPAGTNGDFGFLSAAFTPSLHQEHWQQAVDCLQRNDAQGLRALTLPPAAWKSSDLYGRTLVFYAVQDDRVECCRVLIEKGVPTIQGDRFGQTALHVAAASDAIQCVQLLLQVNQASDALMDKRGQLPIHLAIREGATRCFDFFIARGRFLNQRTFYDLTPLMVAIYNRRWGFAQTLVATAPKVDLEIEMHGGQRAIHEAVEQRNFELVDQLAERVCRVSPVRKDGYTPLLLAAALGESRIFQRLLTNTISADIYEMLPSGDTSLHLAVRSGSLEIVTIALNYEPQLISAQNANKQTPLLLAILCGQFQIANHMLQFIKKQKENVSGLSIVPFVISDLWQGLAGRVKSIFASRVYPCELRTLWGSTLDSILAEPDASNTTPLVAAAEMQLWDIFFGLLREGIQLPPLKQLLPVFARGLTPDLLERIERTQKFTKEEKVELLKSACEFQNVDLVDHLIREKVTEDIEIQEKALEVFVDHDCVYSVQEMIAERKELGERCFKKHGILLLSAQRGSLMTLQWALQEYETPERVRDAMHLATIHGHINCVEVLLLRLPRPNEPLDKKGRNALHRAAVTDSLPMVKYLLTHGLNSSDLDAQGQDALDVFLRRENSEAVSLCMQYQHQTREESLGRAFSPEVLQELLHMGSFSQSALSKALHQFTKRNKPEMVSAILKHGARGDAVLDNGWTPFTFAASCGDEILLSLMMDSIEDPQHKSKGKNALQHAIAGGYVRACLFLLERGLKPSEADLEAVKQSKPWLYNLLRNPNQFQAAVAGVRQAFLIGNIDQIVSMRDVVPFDQSLFRGTDGKLRPLLLAALFELDPSKKMTAFRFIDQLQQDVPVQDQNGESVAHILAKRQLPLYPGFTKVQAEGKTKVPPEVSEAECERRNTAVSVTSQDKKGRCALHVYAGTPSDELLRDAVKGIQEVDLQDAEGCTPLFYAVANARENNVLLLLKAGANPNIRTKKGASCLTIAAGRGDVFLVKTLLAHGAIANYPKEKAFIMALQKGHEDVALLLIRYGADLYAVDEDGSTVAHFAAQGGCRAVLRYLCARGISVSQPNKKGCLPIHLPAEKGDADTLKLFDLAKVQEDFEGDKEVPSLQEAAASSGRQEALDVLWQKGYDPLRSQKGLGTLSHALKKRELGHFQTLLESRIGDALQELQHATLTAITQDNVPALKLLQARGMLFNLPLIDKMTPLHVAASCGSLHTVDFLLRCGVTTTLKDGQGRTAAEIAAGQGNSHILLSLIEAGEQVPNGEKRTLLHLAAMAGRAENCALLLSRGWDPNEKDCHSRTALHHACQKGSFPTVELLLVAGADPLAKGFDENTPDALIPQKEHATKQLWNRFQSSSERFPKGMSQLVRAIHLNLRQYWPLLVEMCEVNTADGNGDSPLHLAVQRREYRLMQQLLHRGAKANTLNGNHRSASDLAEEMGDRDSVMLLAGGK